VNDKDTKCVLTYVLGNMMLHWILVHTQHIRKIHIT